jgi:hypothetical protein
MGLDSLLPCFLVACVRIVASHVRCYAANKLVVEDASPIWMTWVDDFGGNINISMAWDDWT